MKLTKRQIISILAIVFVPLFSSLVWSAARGSGTATGRAIGATDQTLYLINAREEPGYITAPSSSVNNNFVIVSSAVYDLEVLAGNTNYIQLRNTLQSGATFYVSSGTIDRTLFVGSATSRGAITSTTGFVGSGFGLYNFSIPASALQGGATSYIQNTATLQASSTFYVSSGSVANALYVGSATAYGTFTSTTGFIGSGSGLYAFTIPASALQGGATSYIQNAASLQASSTFYVSSASVDGQTLLARTSGNVGISSTVPVYALGITGGLLATSSITAGNFVGSGTAITNLDASSLVQGTVSSLRLQTNLQNTGGSTILVSTDALQSGSVLYVASASVNGQALLARTSGNVGIGTSLPTTKLHVVTESGQGGGAIDFATERVRISGDGRTDNPRIRTNDGTDLNLITQVTSSITFFTGATERIRMDSGGNLGISSATPTALLVVGAGGTTNLNYTTDPFLEPGQHSNCATATPRRVGSFCVQNSVTLPVWIATATTVGGFQPLTMAAE